MVRRMILSITLTDTEYTATMQALTTAQSPLDMPLTAAEQLELLHLMTLLAEAAVKEEQ